MLLVLSAGWREDTSPKFQKNPLSHLRQQSSRTPGGCLQLRTSRNPGIHPGTSTVSLGDREGLLLHCRSTWSRVGVPGGARQDANHGPASKASKEGSRLSHITLRLSRSGTWAPFTHSACGMPRVPVMWAKMKAITSQALAVWHSVLSSLQISTHLKTTGLRGGSITIAQTSTLQSGAPPTRGY